MVRSRLAAALVSLAALTTVPGAGPAAAAEPVPARAEVLYAPSSAAVPNPERGFFHYTETHETPGGRTPLDVARLKAWRTDEGLTLVYRVHYLEAFVGTDSIPQDVLDSVAADLAAARAAGVKLVLRFAYTATDDRDAPVSRVVAHVRRLAPVLNSGADVVAVLQAGFVGRWGEWYYTRNFASDPARPWVVGEADWAARDAVLRTLVEEVTPSIALQVRYPSLGRRAATAGATTRVGLHDDCFVASADDFGTFPTPEDVTWLEQRSRSAPVGGETCAPAGERSSWPSAKADLARFRWSFLNADFHPEVLSSWGGAGLAEAQRRLGYRLRLVRGSFPTAVTGPTTTVSITLRNDGYAAPFTRRPVALHLVGASGTTSVPVPLDVRTLAPGRDVTVEVPVPVPAAPGTYSLRLALPDRAASLRSRPEYSVQLANPGVWDPQTGTNDLGRVLTVTAGRPATTAPVPAPVPAPLEVPVSSLAPASARSGWGPVELDRSNGEAAAGDGRTLSLRGQRFASGLGVHSSADVEYALPAASTSFRATVGVDDETAGRGTVVFAVSVDGVVRYRSPVLSGRSAPVEVVVPTTGASRLRLTVEDGGDGTAHDHADWAGARLITSR